MKIDLKVENAENGYVLTMDGRVFVCSNERQMARRIISKITGNEPRQRKDSIKIFWKDKVGKNEHRILQILERDTYSTIDKVTKELMGHFPTQPRSTIYFNIKNTFIRLVKKGLIKKVSRNSKKYELTEKKPTHVVDTGKKVKV
jgi:hypothetical protein